MMKFHVFVALFVSIAVLSTGSEARNIKIISATRARNMVNQHLIRQAVSATFLQKDCQTVNCIDSLIKKWYCEDRRPTTTTTTTTTMAPLKENHLGINHIEFSAETSTETLSNLQTTKEPADVKPEIDVHSLQVTFQNVPETTTKKKEKGCAGSKSQQAGVQRPTTEGPKKKN